jgi:purine nucleoside phosphorylase
VALVTDYDAGVDGVEPVTQEAVFGFLERNATMVQELLLRAIPQLP